MTINNSKQQIFRQYSTTRWSNFLLGSRGGGRVILALVCLIWGSTFALNKLALHSVGVFALLAVRFATAYLALAVVAVAYRIKTNQPSPFSILKWDLLSVILGLLMFLSYALQTLGLITISPATSGFITGSSVVMVPLTLVFFRQRLRMLSVISAVLALLGLLALSLPLRSGSLSGELLTLGCAIAIALQIVMTEKLVKTVDALSLVLTQLAVVTVFSSVGSFLFDTKSPEVSYSPSHLLSKYVIVAVLVGALLATAFAYVSQAHYQRFIPSSEIGVIFSLEPLFAAIFGEILIPKTLTITQVSGGVAILISMALAARSSNS